MTNQTITTQPLNKAELEKLGELVRNTPEANSNVILWSVRHHLALFIWGIETADQTLNALLLACNTNRPDNIVQLIGLERLQCLRERPLIQAARYDGNFVLRGETLIP